MADLPPQRDTDRAMSQGDGEAEDRLLLGGLLQHGRFVYRNRLIAVVLGLLLVALGLVPG